MIENNVMLNTAILTVGYLLMTIALMVSAVWIYRLTIKIRELERRDKKDEH